MRRKITRKATALTALQRKVEDTLDSVELAYNNIDAEWEAIRPLAKELGQMADLSDRDKIAEYLNRSSSSLTAGLNLIHQGLVKFDEGRENLMKADRLIQNTGGQQ